MKKMLLLLVAVGMTVASCSTSDMKTVHYKAKIVKTGNTIIITSLEPLTTKFTVFSVGDTVSVSSDLTIQLGKPNVVIVTKL